MVSYTDVIFWVGLIPVGVLSIAIAFCCVTYYQKKYLVTDIFCIALLSSLLVNCIIVMPIECAIRVNSIQPPVAMCQALLWLLITFRILPVMYVMWFMIDRLVVLRPFVSVLHKESPLIGTNKSAIVWVVTLFVISAFIGTIPLMYVDSKNYVKSDSCGVVLYDVDGNYATFILLYELTGFTLTFALLVKLFIKTIHAQQRAGKRSWRKQNFVEQINMKAIQDPTQYVENCKMLFAVVMSIYVVNHVPHGILTMLGLLSGGNVASAEAVVMWLTMVEVILVPVVLWAPNERYRNAVKMVITACKARHEEETEDNVFTTSIRFDQNVTIMSSGRHQDRRPPGQGDMPNGDQSSGHSANAKYHANSADYRPSTSAADDHYSSGYGGQDNPAFNALGMDVQPQLKKPVHVKPASVNFASDRGTPKVVKSVSIEPSVRTGFKETSNLQGRDNRAFDADDTHVASSSEIRIVDGDTVVVDLERYVLNKPKPEASSRDAQIDIDELPVDFTVDPGVTYKSSDYHHDYLSDDVSTSESDHHYGRDAKPYSKKRHVRRKEKKSTPRPSRREQVVSPSTSSVSSTTGADSGYNAPACDDSILSDTTDTATEDSHEVQTTAVVENERHRFDNNQGLATLNEIDDYIELCPPSEVKSSLERMQKENSLDKDMFYNTWNSRIDLLVDSSAEKSNTPQTDSVDVDNSTHSKNAFTDIDNNENTYNNDQLKSPFTVSDNNSTPIGVLKERNSAYPRVFSKTGFPPYIVENGSRNLLGSKQKWRSTAIVLSAADYLKNSKHEHLAILDNGHISVTSEQAAEKNSEGQQDDSYLKTYTTDFL